MMPQPICSSGTFEWRLVMQPVISFNQGKGFKSQLKIKTTNTNL